MINASTAMKIAVICVCFLTSCATTEPVVVTNTEYVPIEMDITDSVTLLYDTRPNLAPTTEVDEQDPTLKQAILLALAYKDWGEKWQDYALRLEDYINELKKILLNPVNYEVTASS